jgi:hypothetical protein
MEPDHVTTVNPRPPPNETGEARNWTEVHTPGMRVNQVLQSEWTSTSTV